MRFAFVFALALAVSADARAETESHVDLRRHLVVGEGLGKLGLYSLGYEYALTAELSLGGSAAFYQASYRLVFAASPYASYSRPIRGRHRWFAQLGPELVHEREPSVPGFRGVSATGIGAQLTAGYELRGSRFLFRTHLVTTAGKGGAALWGGFAVGVRL